MNWCRLINGLSFILGVHVDDIIVAIFLAAALTRQLVLKGSKRLPVFASPVTSPDRCATEVGTVFEDQGSIAASFEMPTLHC